MRFIRTYSIEIGIVILILLAHLIIACSPTTSLLKWYSNDDAYYYYQVARNIGSGLGSTFDGISLTNGYHPLWMLICIPIFLLAKLDLILPLRILVMVSALFTGLTSMLLYRLVSRYLSRAAGIFIGIFWALFNAIHSIVTVGGLESALSGFFIVWLIYRLAIYHGKGDTERRSTLGLCITGLIAALAILSRLDNVFFAVIAGVWLLFENKRAANLLMLDLAVLPIFVIAGGYERIWFITGFLILKITFFYFAGMYDDTRQYIIAAWKNLITASILPTIIGVGIIYIHQIISKINSFPGKIVILDIILTLAWILISRYKKWSVHPIHNSDINQTNILKGIRGVIPAAFYYALPNFILLTIYLIYNRLTFGSFTPISGQIKQWWSTLNNTIYGHIPTNFGEILGITGTNQGPWYLVRYLFQKPLQEIIRILNISDPEILVVMSIGFALLIGVILYLLMRKNVPHWFDQMGKLAIPAVLAGCSIQILYYGTSGYIHTRSWYWVSEFILTTLVMAIVIEAVRKSIAGISGERSGNWLLYLGSLIIILTFVIDIVRDYPYQVSKNEANPFILMARDLEANTEPGSLIGTSGGGGLAYFIRDRKIINLDGLMNSYEYFQMMKNGTADQYLNRIGLNYVHEKKYVLEQTDPYKSFLPKHLIRIGIVAGFPLFKYSPIPTQAP